MATEVIQMIAPPNPHITRAPPPRYRPPLSQSYVCHIRAVLFVSLVSIPLCAIPALVHMSQRPMWPKFQHQPNRPRIF